MSNQTQQVAMDKSKRRGRGCLLWLGGAVVVILVLILAGTIYESVAEAADLQLIPLPVNIDVGGYRLHINCTGEGSPTVVVETGWGIRRLRGVGYSPKSPGPRASAPTIEPGWGGAGQSPAAGSPGIC